MTFMDWSKCAFGQIMRDTTRELQKYHDIFQEYLHDIVEPHIFCSKIDFNSDENVLEYSTALFALRVYAREYSTALFALRVYAREYSTALFALRVYAREYSTALFALRVYAREYSTALFALRVYAREYKLYKADMLEGINMDPLIEQLINKIDNMIDTIQMIYDNIQTV
jgi:hypothetical protein